jgi:hypothetical protein
MDTSAHVRRAIRPLPAHGQNQAVVHRGPKSAEVRQEVDRKRLPVVLEFLPVVVAASVAAGSKSAAVVRKYAVLVQ